jgi:hypothetical protein
MLAPMQAARLLAVLVLALGSSVTGASAEEAAPPSDVDPEMVQAVREAADFLAKAERVSFRADIQWDAAQADGEKIEFGSTRKTVLRRPNHLRAEWERRDGNRGRFYFDGSAFTVYDADENVFATAPWSGDIDAMIEHVQDALDFPIPLASLIRSDLAERTTRGLVSAQWVGEAKLGDTVCDQIALRNDDVDFQLWIAQGKLPVFRRIVVNYRSDEGQPQFRVDLSDWNFKPDASDATFAFKAPAGAEKIPFAPRARPGAQTGPSGGSP